MNSKVVQAISTQIWLLNWQVFRKLFHINTRKLICSFLEGRIRFLTNLFEARIKEKQGCRREGRKLNQPGPVIWESAKPRAGSCPWVTITSCSTAGWDRVAGKLLKDGGAGWQPEPACVQVATRQVASWPVPERVWQAAPRHWLTPVPFLPFCTRFSSCFLFLGWQPTVSTKDLEQVNRS